jgi:hypothetical protein
MFDSYRTRDHLTKFGTIPDLFWGGRTSTYNYSVKSRENSIKQKKSTKSIQKNLKLGGSFTHGMCNAEKNFETNTTLE